MKTKRIISAILLCAVVLSVAFCAVGCKQDETLPPEHLSEFCGDYYFKYFSIIIGKGDSAVSTNYGKLEELTTATPIQYQAVEYMLDIFGKEMSFKEKTVSFTGIAEDQGYSRSGVDSVLHNETTRKYITKIRYLPQYWQLAQMMAYTSISERFENFDMRICYEKRVPKN